MRVPHRLRRVVLLVLLSYFASMIYVSYVKWQAGQVGTLLNTRGSATVQARHLSFECTCLIQHTISAKCPQFISRCNTIQMTDLSIVPCHYSQAAWNEKVLVLRFRDFWLKFPYFRTLRNKMRLILKSSIDSFLRYGNPDYHFLGFLIWKLKF